MGGRDEPGWGGRELSNPVAKDRTHANVGAYRAVRRSQKVAVLALARRQRRNEHLGRVKPVLSVTPMLQFVAEQKEFSYP